MRLLNLLALFSAVVVALQTSAGILLPERASTSLGASRPAEGAIDSVCILPTKKNASALLQWTTRAIVQDHHRMTAPDTHAPDLGDAACVDIPARSNRHVLSVVSQEESYGEASPNIAHLAMPSKNSESQSTEAAGGALPQQMKSSVAGLLGFCIMGLIML